MKFTRSCGHESAESFLKQSLVGRQVQMADADGVQVCMCRGMCRRAVRGSLTSARSVSRGMYVHGGNTLHRAEHPVVNQSTWRKSHRRASTDPPMNSFMTELTSQWKGQFNFEYACHLRTRTSKSHNRMVPILVQVIFMH